MPLSGTELFKNTNVGFEFEFYCDDSNHDEVADRLSKYLKKKIHVEYKSHSPFQPSSEIYKLEKDFSGGAYLLELITGPMPYIKAKEELLKVSNWIKKNGRTTDRCSIHLNVSFNTKFANVFNLNVLKFILDFDEQFIYDLFPRRENSVYAKSIKRILPRNKDYDIMLAKDIEKYDYIYPTEKYYGINFGKVGKNYIELRYLGGKDWENRIHDITSVLDYFIKELYNNIRFTVFNEVDKIKLKNILDKSKKMRLAYNSIKDFNEQFPDIQFTVDLKDDIQTLELYWQPARKDIYQLLTVGSFSEGLLNYDTDTGRLQIKDSSLNKIYNIERLDLINCEISGNVKNCDLFNCKIISSNLDKCNLFNHSRAEDSKLMNCYVNKSASLKDCFVSGPNSVMNGYMEGGILRKGKISKVSQFKDVEQVEYKKIEL